MFFENIKFFLIILFTVLLVACNSDVDVSKSSVSSDQKISLNDNQIQVINEAREYEKSLTIDNRCNGVRHDIDVLTSWNGINANELIPYRYNGKQYAKPLGYFKDFWFGSIDEESLYELKRKNIDYSFNGQVYFFSRFWMPSGRYVEREHKPHIDPGVWAYHSCEHGRPIPSENEYIVRLENDFLYKKYGRLYTPEERMQNSQRIGKESDEEYRKQWQKDPENKNLLKKTFYLGDPSRNYIVHKYRHHFDAEVEFSIDCYKERSCTGDVYRKSDNRNFAISFPDIAKNDTGKIIEMAINFEEQFLLYNQAEILNNKIP